MSRPSGRGPGRRLEPTNYQPILRRSGQGANRRAPLQGQGYKVDGGALLRARFGLLARMGSGQRRLQAFRAENVEGTPSAARGTASGAETTRFAAARKARGAATEGGGLIETSATAAAALTAVQRGESCVDGVCEGEVCEGELLTPVGGGDPICSCSGFCAASCDECPSGTICTNGPTECGTPPTLACSTPCGEPICNPPCPFPCGCYARADGPGTVCVDCSVGCQEPVSSCAECTDPQTVCFINDAGGIGCGRPCPPCLPDGRFCFEDANCCSLLCVNNTCGG